MYCEENFYMCKNLLYYEDNIEGYICTITCEPCVFQDTGCKCLAFCEEREE